MTCLKTLTTYPEISLAKRLLLTGDNASETYLAEPAEKDALVEIQNLINAANVTAVVTTRRSSENAALVEVTAGDATVVNLGLSVRTTKVGAGLWDPLFSQYFF